MLFGYATINFHLFTRNKNKETIKITKCYTFHSVIRNSKFGGNFIAPVVFNLVLVAPLTLIIVLSIY